MTGTAGRRPEGTTMAQMNKRNQSYTRGFSARPRSGTDRTRHARRGRSSTLVFGVILAGCLSPPPILAIPGPPAAAEFTFEQHEVVIGSAKRQTVLTGFLLGGAVAELAVVHIDEDDDRRLRIYAFGGGTWAPTLEATLRPEVLFVDVADIGGRDRLVTYEPGRLNWFDPDSATERELVAVTSNFHPPRRDEIPHVDVTRDVNADGRDDLVLPDSDGFWVFIQMSDRAFADPVKIGPSFEMARVYEPHGYRYTPWDQGRIHEMDYDRDGRPDLVFWNEDHFEARLQDARGLFGTTARTFTTDVSFDSDDLASLAAPHNIRRPAPHNPIGAMTGRVLHSLADLNGDGIADLGVFSLEGGSLWKMHSTYEVHLGSPAPDGGTTFAPEVSTAAPSDGIPLGIRRHDLDSDGQVVMMFTSFKVGVFKVLGTMLTRSATMNLAFWRTEGGIYPDKPSTTRKTEYYALGKSGGPAAVYPAVLIGDVNGDRRSDLLVGRSRRALHVFPGVPGPELFARRPQKVAVAMASRKYTWLVDLNQDGKQDILLHHPPTTGPHRLTMLIAR